MEINKKIYKYISIISFTIVAILLSNLILPLCSIAKTSTSDFLNDIVYTQTEERETLKEVATAPAGYKKYLLYWAKEGENPLTVTNPGNDASNEEKIEYLEELVGWFITNAIENVIELPSNEINSEIEINEKGKYYVLCLCESDSERRAEYAMISLSESNEEIPEQQPEVETDNVDILVGKLKDENTIYMQIVATKGNILEIKYCITDSILEINKDKVGVEESNRNKQYIKDNGVNIDVSQTSKNEKCSIDDSDIQAEKYINLYVKTNFNNTEMYISMPISNVTEYEKIPWEDNKNNETGEGEETPGKPEETPGEGEETPGKPEETPGEGEETPGKPEETPGEGEEIPGKPEETLGEGEETPGKSEETPGEGEETPGKPEETPGESEGTSGKPEEIPGGNEGTQGKPEETPGEQNNTLNENKGTVDGENKNNNLVENNKNDIPEKEDLPQTGSNDQFIVMCIIIFVMIGIISFVKYRNIK